MTKEELAQALTELGIDPQLTKNLKVEMNRKFDSINGILTAITEKAEDGTITLKVSQPAPAKKEDQKDDKVTSLEQQVQALIKANQEKDQKIAAKELNDAVVSALTDAGCINPAQYSSLVRNSVKRGEDGSFYTLAKDQYGVETKVDLKTSFTGFLKDHPELAKPAAKAGSGTPSSGQHQQLTGGKDVASLAEMSTDQFFAAMSK